jgi:hypothetical protein
LQQYSNSLAYEEDPQSKLWFLVQVFGEQ